MAVTLRGMPRYTSHPVSDLNTFHRNPRRGDVNAIAVSLARHGQYRPIVVNEGSVTGRPFEVLAGNHTLLAARSLGWESIDVALIDVDEETATSIVLADNRLADLGDYDNTDLVDLLDSLNGDYLGTGYDDAFLDDLHDLLNPPDSADALTPPDGDKYDRQFAVTVICNDEEHQAQVYEKPRADGLVVRVVSV